MMKRGLLFFSAALPVFVLSSNAFAATPGEDLVQEWLSSISGGLGATVGTSSYDPALRTVELQNVRIGNADTGAFEIDIDDLSVTDPRRAPDDMFAADALRASGYHLRIRWDLKGMMPATPAPALEKTGDEHPAPTDQKPVGVEPAAPDEAAAKPQPTEPAKPAPVLNYAIAADALSIDRLVSPLRAPAIATDADPFMRFIAYARWSTLFRIDWFEGSGITLETSGIDESAFKATYGSAFVSGVKEGRIERGGFNDVEQKFTSGKSPVSSVTIDSGYFSSIDSTAMLDVIDPAAYKDGKGDGARRTVYGQYGLNGLKASLADKVSLGIDNMEVDGLFMRQTARPLYDVISGYLKTPEAVDENPLPLIADVLPNVTQMMGVELARLTGLHVASGEDATFDLGGLELSDVDGNGIGRFHLSDAALDVKAAESSGKLDLLSVGNVRFGDLAPFLALVKEAQAGGTPTAETLRNAILDGGSRVGFIEAAGLSVDTPAGSGGFGGLAITQSDFLRSLPRRLDITLTNANAPVAAIPDDTVRQQLTDMGYETLAVTGGLTLSWDTDKGDVRLEDLTLKAREMGSVSMDVHLGNLPLSIIDKPDELETRLMEGTLVSGSLTYGNEGIVEKAFDVQAKKMKQNGETFRKNMAGAIPLMLTFLNDKAIQKQFEKPVKDFLNDPKSVSLSVKPKAPVSFSILETFKPESPAEAFKLLGLDIKANE